MKENINMHFLKMHHPELYARVVEYGPTNHTTLEKTRNGMVNLLHSSKGVDRYMHDCCDPVAEAYQFWNGRMKKDQHVGILAIFGLGIG